MPLEPKVPNGLQMHLLIPAASHVRQVLNDLPHICAAVFARTSSGAMSCCWAAGGRDSSLSIIELSWVINAPNGITLHPEHSVRWKTDLISGGLVFTEPRNL